MNTQQEKTDYEVFDQGRTVLGEIKAIILRNQVQSKIAAQPNVAVDHLTDEKVLEPIAQSMPQVQVVEETSVPTEQNLTTPNVQAQPQIIQPVQEVAPQTVIVPNNVEPTIVNIAEIPTTVSPEQVDISTIPVQNSVISSVNNVPQSSVPEVNANPIDMQTNVVPNLDINISVDDVVQPNNTLQPVQTELVDSPNIVETSQFIETPNNQGTIIKENSGFDDVPAISVGDFSVPSIASPTTSNNQVPPISNPSAVPINPISTVLDTGEVQLPNGTNSEITNDPTMVVGPESFTRAV